MYETQYEAQTDYICPPEQRLAWLAQTLCWLGVPTENEMRIKLRRIADTLADQLAADIAPQHDPQEAH